MRAMHDPEHYMTPEQLLRDVRLSTADGHFRLRTWDTYETDGRGVTIIAYQLDDERAGCPIFVGADFAGSPLSADDSDECLRSLLGFLSLRPGDVEPEYFEHYSAEQLAFAEIHGEELGCYAFDDSASHWDEVLV